MDKDKKPEDLSPEKPENPPSEPSGGIAENKDGEPAAEAVESAPEQTPENPPSDASGGIAENKDGEPAAEAVESAPEQKPVDLSVLEDFHFGTHWSESKPAGAGGRPSGRGGRDGEGRSRQGPRDRKDRRAFKPGSFRKPERNEGGRADGPHRPEGFHRRKGQDRQEAPRKVIEAFFHPEEGGFNAICKALRTSTITYELFDIARTILEKEERFYVVLRPVHPENESREGEAHLYVAESDGMPFLSRETAKQHALSTCLDHFFTAETKEVDPPSGSFSSIRKCGFTGELLGPPNFHGLKKIMADHHATRLAHLPFVKFESRIETVTDEEVVAAWLEKMKTRTSYTLKAEYGGPREFEYGETARAYAAANLGEKLVKPQTSIKLNGAQIHQVVDPLIKANLIFAWERQKRFPLDTANLLRGRLRRQRFAIFKKGAKGVTYVCAVKRKFREPGQEFSEPVQKLLEFLEENPDISVKDLTKTYLGFSKMDAESGQPVELSPEQEKAFKAMNLDFQWLLKEGYIAEFSDGRILANPVAGPGQGFIESKPKAARKETPVAEAPAKTGTPAKENQEAAENVAEAGGESQPSEEDQSLKPDEKADEPAGEAPDADTPDATPVVEETESSNEPEAEEPEAEEPARPEAKEDEAGTETREVAPETAEETREDGEGAGEEENPGTELKKSAKK